MVCEWHRIRHWIRTRCSWKRTPSTIGVLETFSFWSERRWPRYVVLSCYILHKLFSSRTSYREHRRRQLLQNEKCTYRRERDAVFQSDCCGQINRTKTRRNENDGIRSETTSSQSRRLSYIWAIEIGNRRGNVLNTRR